MSALATLFAAMLASSAVGADGYHDHGCSETPHDGGPCACEREVTFYGPWTPPPPIYVNAPGVHVYSRPINIEGPAVYIQSPPVWVDAPPIRVAPAQIYVQRPDVRVRPSEITIAPPQVHFADCPDGSTCVSAPPAH